MSKDKSFALYATSKKPTRAWASSYRSFTVNDGKKDHTIYVRAELHDCHYDEAMNAVALRDGENFLNTQPA